MIGRGGRLARASIGVAVVVPLATACQGVEGVDGTLPATPTESVSPVASAPPVTPTPSPSPVETATGEPTPETPDEEREAELERLRATNHYVEFAEAERARTATWARFAYHHFAPHADGERLFEWANKDELWNSIAPTVRDECLLAGPPATRPMWDAQIVIPASLNPTWSNESTEGRGHFLEFLCFYEEPAGQLGALWLGALVTTEEEPLGSTRRLSPPVFVTEPEYTTLEQASSAVLDRLWEWIKEQPQDDQPEE